MPFFFFFRFFDFLMASADELLFAHSTHIESP